MNYRLPFKVGQQAESKSFIPGYRGAWFRCNVKDIRWKKEHTLFYLEFFDFPDEKKKWTKLYQKPSARQNSQQEQLMVRPSFPRLCQESQMPDAHSISEVIAVANDTWKVGDLVDWWYEGCYWSGTIVLLLGKDKVQIALLDPPLGEGKTYEAFCKDLRPSLDWSPEYGWTVPVSGGNETSHHCVILVHPSVKNHDQIKSAAFQNQDRSEMPAVGPSPSSSKKLLNQTNKADMNMSHMNTELEREDRGIEKANCIDTVSNSPNRETDVSSPVKKVSSIKDRDNFRDPSKKMRTCEAERTTSMMYSDTIDSSVIALEELANKIKWLKGVLQHGVRQSDAMKPSWKLMETHASFL